MTTTTEACPDCDEPLSAYADPSWYRATGRIRFIVHCPNACGYERLAGPGDDEIVSRAAESAC